MTERPYVSGPMTGREHHNFPAFFDAEEKLIAMGYDPLNPARCHRYDTWEEAEAHHTNDGMIWCDYIKRDMKTLLRSDSIALLPEWEVSRGACIELAASVCMGYDVFYYLPEADLLHKLDAVEPAYLIALESLKEFSTVDPWTMYNV